MFTTASTKKDDTCGHLHMTRDEAQKCLSKYVLRCRDAYTICYRSVIEVADLGDLNELWDN